MKFNRYLLKATIVGALGGLLFGFDTAVIAGTEKQLTHVFALDPHRLALTVAIGLVGTVIGAMFSGELGQKIGGREALRIMAALYLISAVGCAVAWSWPVLLVARVIGGLGIGGSSVLGPVYIAELAPAKWRGRMVGLFQINIVVGILLAYLSNFIVAAFHLGAAQWRWQFGIAILPSLVFLILLYTIPRSSRWLVTTDQTAEAREVLHLMGSPDADSELADIIASVQRDQGVAEEPLFRAKYLKPLYLAATIGIFNQLTGINAILYYANYIFNAAGFSENSAGLQAVGIGLANLLATFVGMALIDKLGRKTLLLIGAAGMTLSLGGVAAVFHTHMHLGLLIWLLVGFILFFAISQGSVIWVYIAEVFPSLVRSKGQSVGCSSHWIMNALVAYAFPLIATRSQSLPFAFFAAATALQFVLVLFTYPETKGQSLESIQANLHLH